MNAPTQHDLTSAMRAFLDANDPGRRFARAEPNATVDGGDGMYSGDQSHYVATGYSALQMIHQSLHASDVTVSEVKSVLDYACGFGRVTRWLQSGFPHAKILAADLDPKAIEATGRVLKVETMQLTKDLSVPPPGKFDLVWIGSLFTHLDDDHTGRVLQFLRKALTPTGLIVASTHGLYVVNRLETREKTYNVPEAAVSAMLKEYHDTGSAFAPYSGMADYGISIIRPYKMARIAMGAGFDFTFFKARGWAQHQDCFCFRQAF